tara:strand:- start:1572 stop:1796 length:225 start_codon:yes stop_codon:yes gene_type:complete
MLVLNNIFNTLNAFKSALNSLLTDVVSFILLCYYGGSLIHTHFPNISDKKNQKLLTKCFFYTKIEGQFRQSATP